MMRRLSNQKAARARGWSRHSVRVVVPSAICVLAAASSAAGVSPKTSAILLPSQVPAIVNAYAAANNKSNTTLSTTNQAKDEAGTTLFMDNSAFIFAKKAGWTQSGYPVYYKFGFAPTSTAVTPSSNFPANFATIAHFTYPASTPAAKRANPAAQQILVFHRFSASTPWTVVDYPLLTPKTGAFATGPDGFALPPPTTGLMYPPTLIANRVAGALQTYARTGVRDEGLAASDFNYSGHYWSLPDLWKIVQHDKNIHVTNTVSVTPFSTSDYHTYELTSNQVLVLFSVKITYRFTNPGGWVVFNNVRLQPNTWEIPAGHYRWAKTPAICQVAAVDTVSSSPPPSSTSIPTLVGVACGDVVGATGQLY